MNSRYQRHRDIEPPKGKQSRPPLPANVVGQIHSALYKALSESPGELDDYFVEPKVVLVDDPQALVSSIYGDSQRNGESPTKLDAFVNLVHNLEPANPLLVIGHIGIGKSTLLKYTFASLKHRHSDDLPIRIDFFSIPGDRSRLYEHLHSRLTAELDAMFDMWDSAGVFDLMFPERKALFDNLAIANAQVAYELKALAVNRLLANPSEWNIARLLYLVRVARRKPILLFDNVDHHHDREFIETVLATAFVLGGTCGSRVLVTLRPGNYGLAYEQGAYAARPVTVVRVSSPDVSALLKKRVALVLGADVATTQRADIHVGSVRVQPRAYVEYLRERINSLLTSTDILKMLSALANDNVHILLGIIRHVFQYEGKDFFDDPDRAYLTVYEVIERIVRPTRREYISPELDPEGFVINLFEDESPSSFGNNLIRIRVLQYIQAKGSNVLRRDICDVMGNAGFLLTQVNKTLEVLETYRLVEPGDHSVLIRALDGETISFSLTQRGGLYLNTLLFEIRYGNAVREDVYFPEATFRKIFTSGTEHPTRDLAQMLNETMAFVDFIAEREADEEAAWKARAICDEMVEKFARVAGRMRTSYAIAHKRMLEAGERTRSRRTQGRHD